MFLNFSPEEKERQKEREKEEMKGGGKDGRKEEGREREIGRVERGVRRREQIGPHTKIITKKEIRGRQMAVILEIPSKFLKDFSG